MSAKSNPGDGVHGKGVKGGRSGTPSSPIGPFQFLRDLVRGLRAFHRS
jgi:hypothetical protein